ncbi:MAG: glycosyltransferase family 39 protein, partial [Chloroflexaceae bacterium]|nr:glycosyltransferase family 39 protein [Chloroflexaceae bacterium]
MIATKPVSTAPLLARLKPHHLLLGCILLLGALLRVYQLDRESYWVDEIITLGVAREGLLAIIEEAVGGRPPVYFLLSHVWLQLFGTAETATRLMPALISIASLPLLYMVGQQLFGRRIALIATLLLALAPIQLYQSQNIRYYSLYIFCTLLSYYCMLRALGQERRAWYVAYVLASLLLVYVHTLAVFVVAAQNLYMLLCWRRHRASVYPWVIAQGLIMLGILPFIAGSLTRSSSAEATDVVNWVLPPPLVAPLRTLALFVSIRPPGPALILLAGLLLLLGVVLAWWQRRRPAVANEPSVPAPAQQPFNRPVLLACWLLCPILLLFAASYIVGPMYLDRYTLTASPALYLLLGLGVVA